jgi:hypothetical protein
MSMQQTPSDAVRDCQRRAAECRSWAERARDPDTRAHYLRMETRWHKLARSYGLKETVAEPA